MDYEKLVKDIKSRMPLPANFTMDELKEAINSLDDDCLKIIIYRYQDKIPRRKIAEKLGLSSGAVDYRIRKAIGRVGRYIRSCKKEYIVELTSEHYLPYLDYTGLSIRAFNALYRNQITPDKLKNMNDEDILKLRNIGPKTQAEIIAFRDTL